MNKQWFYNPFIYVAGSTSLLIGLGVIGITSIVAYLTGTHYYGMLNIDFAKDVPFHFFLIENVSNWIFMTGFLNIAGLLISKSKIRLVDVAGTLAMSRYPLIFTALLRFIPGFQSFSLLSPVMYVIVIVHILAVVWCFALFYNAFSVSCNTKGTKSTISFIVAVLFAEILTKGLLYMVRFQIKF